MQSNREARGGFTIVEVIVAIMILTIGVLGLAGTTGLLVQQVTMGEIATKRAVALQSAIEYLNSIDFANVGSDTISMEGFTVAWTVTDSASQSKNVRLVVRGPGIVSSPYPRPSNQAVDTFTYTVLNR